MSEYIKLLQQRANNIEIESKVCINDKTMRKTYFIYCNLHMDFGLCEEMYQHLCTTRKREFNKVLQKIKQATKRKFKLTRTDNSLGYTRLIYTLQKD